MQTINDFQKIVLEDIHLIDVRAPIEYQKGAFPNSINLPIMNDKERHLVGITYKEEGNKKATELGHELVTGSKKQERIDAWIKDINAHPNTIIYCFRGGSRSKISQKWIEKEIGKLIPRISGGYKAFRNYLMDALLPENQSSKPILLGGNTGSGKTTLLKQFTNFIDLEQIANHRGSSFGHYITPQPTQINFENHLAYALIKHQQNAFILLEDEGRNIGRCFIPKPLADHFNKGALILLDVPYQKRIENTFNEYVKLSQNDYQIQFGQEQGLLSWYEYIKSSVQKIQKRLGGERLKRVLQELDGAFKYQQNTSDNIKHINWIEILLKEYYDPMYEYQIKTTKKKVLYKGNTKEVTEFLSQYEK